MKIDILILAEGAVIDGRGTLSLIGVNQRVISPLSLPFHIKQRLIMALSDEAPESPEPEFGQIPSGEVAVKVLDPTGSATFATSEEIKAPTEKQWLDLPLVLNVIMDVDIKGDSYGIYTVEVRYTPPDSGEQLHRFPIYVVSPQMAFNTETFPRRAITPDRQTNPSASSSS